MTNLSDRPVDESFCDGQSDAPINNNKQTHDAMSNVHTDTDSDITTSKSLNDDINANDSISNYGKIEDDKREIISNIHGYKKFHEYDNCNSIFFTNEEVFKIRENKMSLHELTSNRQVLFKNNFYTVQNMNYDEFDLYSNTGKEYSMKFYVNKNDKIKYAELRNMKNSQIHQLIVRSVENLI